MPQQALTFEKTLIQPTRLEYLRHLPSQYDPQSSERLPLILFLHGAGERGSDLQQMAVHGIPKVADTLDLPFITLSPQCPVNHWWSDFLPALDALIEESIHTLNVDPARIYLTGLSMGGFGTWHMAVEYPQRFAAIAPICGMGYWAFGFPERVCEIKNTPIWVFHGAKDPVVPPSASQELVDELTKCAAPDVRFTLYPEAEHDSWTETYNNPDLYAWFLSHNRTPEGTRPRHEHF